MYGLCELLAPISQAFKNDVDFLHFAASPVLLLFGEIIKGHSQCWLWCDSHLDSLHEDPPGTGRLVQELLQDVQ